MSARLAALVLALSSVLAACDLAGSDEPKLTPSPVGTPDVADPTKAPDRVGSPLRTFYAQKPSWRDCRAGARCTTIRVPLDYAHPGRRSIELSVLKVPATDRDHRIGSMVVNPGGPGGSGVDYAANASTYFGTELRAAFDIVGFDPRGVGESTPLDCASDALLDELVAADPDPESAVEQRGTDEVIGRLLTGCLDRDAALARHMSTAEAARDIDILRSALGEPRLVYFGASYGSFLGATYAELFPGRVGRMVFDGALDPSIPTVRLALEQGRGFETALRSYVGHCVAEGSCFLGDTVDEGTARVRGLLDELDAHPLPGDGERRLTEGAAVLGIWAPLYNEDYWPILDTALEMALRGAGAGLLSLADAYTSRGPDGYVDNSLEALFVVNCLDRDEAVPAARIPGLAPRFERVSPTWGRIFAAGLTGCANWPVHTGRGAAPVHAKGVPPTLVIGTSRDPATPLRWAESLAKQIDNAVLVRRDGDGHTGYRAGNSCVDQTVERYLVSGVVPKSTVDC